MSEPVHCPYLGLRQNRAIRFAAPTEEHRCFRDGTPIEIPVDQRAFCLSAQYKTCPLYTGQWDASTQGAAAGAKPNKRALRPGAGQREYAPGGGSRRNRVIYAVIVAAVASFLVFWAFAFTWLRQSPVALPPGVPSPTFSLPNVVPPVSNATATPTPTTTPFPTDTTAPTATPSASASPSTSASASPEPTFPPVPTVTVAPPPIVVPTSAPEPEQPTDAPTDAPVEPTQEPTSAPPPTDAPTDVPTEPPTAPPPTLAPPPTDAPTSAPVPTETTSPPVPSEPTATIVLQLTVLPLAQP